MSTPLDQIAKKAKSNPKLRFTSLAHLLTPEFLTETWRQMNRRGASGVDGETTKEFEQGLDTRVQELCERLKRGSYRAPPVRRVEIPKGPGKAGTRPLGIPTVEDRLLQRAVARILEAVFEADFLECSYGFRPGRNPHGALRALRGIIVTKKVGHLFEADIRGYFNHIQHEWLQKMVAHRMADPFILRLIGKWLNAGFMVGGVVTRTEEGSPQGGPISPILCNIYLHFVLDLWFEKKIRPACQGEAYLTRFADDFVVNFQYRRDAEEFHKNLTDRFGKFGLELAEEKTRVMRFGRFVRADLAKTGEKPDTFDFLGFKHVCGTDRGGKFALVRVPCDKSRRKFLAKSKQWLSQHRHWKRRDQQKQLVMMQQRGHRFTRYADDCNIYVRSRRAGERVMSSVTRLLTTKLKLRVNSEKSAVARPWERKFLGFSFTNHKQPKRRLAPKAVTRFKERVRELTGRTRGISLVQMVHDLAEYLRGWIGYFGRCETPDVLNKLEQWVRRRLRSMVWKQWKRGTTRYRELRQRGIAAQEAARMAGSSDGPWHLANTPALKVALSNSYFALLGLSEFTVLG